jgi:hypothetical protein
VPRKAGCALAIVARNGWRVIVGRCADRDHVRDVTRHVDGLGLRPLIAGSRNNNDAGLPEFRPSAVHVSVSTEEISAILDSTEQPEHFGASVLQVNLYRDDGTLQASGGGSTTVAALRRLTHPGLQAC